MTADPQRESVYEAEARIHQGSQLYSARQVTDYVGSITRSAYWHTLGMPDVKVRITSARQCGTTAKGGFSAARREWYVKLPGYPNTAVEERVTRSIRNRWPVARDDWPWAWCELIVCHELAHIVTLVAHDDDSHSTDFCGRYIELVHRTLGDVHALELILALRLERVEFTNPDVPPGPLLGPAALTAAGWRPYVAATLPGARPGEPAARLPGAVQRLQEVG